MQESDKPSVIFTCQELPDGNFEFYIKSYNEATHRLIEEVAQQNGLTYEDAFEAVESNLLSEYVPSLMDLYEEMGPASPSYLDAGSLENIERMIEEHQAARQRVLRNAGFGELMKKQP